MLMFSNNAHIASASVRLWHFADVNADAEYVRTRRSKRTSQAKVGGHPTAHQVQPILVRPNSDAEVIAQDRLGQAIKDGYFGTPTNRAPVNLPSPPMSGA